MPVRPTRRARWAALLGAVLLATAPLLAGAPVQAHTELISASPAQGDVVESLPGSVELTFSEAVGSTAYVVVNGPDGQAVSDGDPQVVDGVVTQRTVGTGAAGAYTVDYRVVSADGHPVSGQVGFTVGSGTGPTPGPTTQPGFWDEHGWHVALGGVGLLAGVVLLGAGLRRS
jgi:methionine-rich copper-binding protein CopC